MRFCLALPCLWLRVCPIPCGSTVSRPATTAATHTVPKLPRVSICGTRLPGSSSPSASTLSINSVSSRSGHICTERYGGKRFPLSSAPEVTSQPSSTPEGSELPHGSCTRISSNNERALTERARERKQQHWPMQHIRDTRWVLCSVSLLKEEVIPGAGSCRGEPWLRQADAMRGNDWRQISARDDVPACLTDWLACRAAATPFST